MRMILVAATGLSLLAAPAFAHGHRGPAYVQGPQVGPDGSYQGPWVVDPRCRQDRRTAGVVGGVLGATAGGAAGRALAAASVRPEGVILGAVVGAVVGARVGSAAIDCTPRPLYTQDGGRSYGQVGYQGVIPQVALSQPYPTAYAPDDGRPFVGAPMERPPAYVVQSAQAPVHQAPVYQPPVYQPPVAYSGGHAFVGAPMERPPAFAVQAAPAPVYVGPALPAHPPLAAAPPSGWYAPSSQSFYGREHSGAWSAGAAWSGQSTVTQTWSTGPTYVPAPPVAPPMQPCGVWVCR